VDVYLNLFAIVSQAQIGTIDRLVQNRGYPNRRCQFGVANYVCPHFACSACGLARLKIEHEFDAQGKRRSAIYGCSLAKVTASNYELPPRRTWAVSDARRLPPARLNHSLSVQNSTRPEQTLDIETLHQGREGGRDELEYRLTPAR
jgi:hypothetical protein